MYFGRLLTLINFALLGIAIVVYFFAPLFATIFLYILIAWMFASLVLFYLPISRRQIGRPATGAPRSVAPPTAAAPTLSTGAPLPSGSAGGRSASPPLSSPGSAAPQPIGFCIYCGAHLATNSGFCPACGHPVHEV